MTTKQTPESVIAPLISPRFKNAEHYATLFYLLRKETDTTLLCLLIEFQHHGIKKPTYRELATKGDGFISRAAIGKSLLRLQETGFISVSDTAYTVNMEAVHNALQNPPKDKLSAINSQLFLWLNDALPNKWQSAILLSALIRQGAVDTWKEMHYRQVMKTATRGIIISIDRLHEHRNYLLQQGIIATKRPDDWFVHGDALHELLVRAESDWITNGQPEEPWEAGLQLAVNALEPGSTPGEGASSDESPSSTL